MTAPGLSGIDQQSQDAAPPTRWRPLLVGAPRGPGHGKSTRRPTIPARPGMATRAAHPTPRQIEDPATHPGMSSLPGETNTQAT